MQAATDDTLQALRRGDLAGTRALRIPGGVAEFPREIFGLADTLELLDLSGGTLDGLPEDFGRLHRLRVLFCSGNRFERLPPCLGDCASLSQVGFRGSGLREVPGEALPPGLRWLTLTDNRIETLPRQLGERPHLQKLMLAGNRLSALPDSLAQAARLELVRLSANRFDALPDWLVELPRLAWLSWAGNPCEPGPEISAAAEIPWSQLECGEVLGDGASGIVHRALWRAGDGSAGRAVAVKLFKGAMTSDGLPDREMATSLAAGGHPGLVGGLGRLVGHPHGVEGLIMPLLASEWRPLAGPPSLESCSRDVYDPDLQVTPGAVHRIARCVAEALAHLHGTGVCHGDLYAHNLMWDGGAGHAALSDFGAASLLPGGVRGTGLRRVETRAFGILLGELIDRAPDLGDARLPLAALAEECLRADPGARPDMSEVARILSGIEAGYSATIL